MSLMDFLQGLPLGARRSVVNVPAAAGDNFWVVAAVLMFVGDRAAT
jgi:hypothetical protein